MRNKELVNETHVNFLRAKTRKEVSEEYCISQRTLAHWFKKANLWISSGLIDPSHLKITYTTFGIPKNLLISRCPVLSCFVQFCQLLSNFF